MYCHCFRLKSVVTSVPDLLVDIPQIREYLSDILYPIITTDIVSIELIADVYAEVGDASNGLHLNYTKEHCSPKTVQAVETDEQLAEGSTVNSSEELVMESGKKSIQDATEDSVEESAADLTVEFSEDFTEESTELMHMCSAEINPLNHSLRIVFPSDTIEDYENIPSTQVLEELDRGQPENIHSTQALEELDRRQSEYIPSTHALKKIDKEKIPLKNKRTYIRDTWYDSDKNTRYRQIICG